MIRDFSKDELETAESGKDTELTLGGGTLLILGCGLFVLCALCFSIGYFVGHRPSPGPAMPSGLSSNSKPLSVPTGSASKPGAAGQTPAKPQSMAAANVSSGTPGTERPQTAGQVAVVPGDKSGSQPHLNPVSDSQVHPALASQTSATQPTSALRVQPAITPIQGWMVQIAAVSHPEDAEVLVNALRKRGYAVTARREVGDNLIHVQTGPFTNRNDADAMRQKLLNDGYNAMIQ